MNSMLIVGIALAMGLLLGRAAHRVGLPKVTGNSVGGIVIGATVIHELVGPVLSTVALRKANEIE